MRVVLDTNVLVAGLASARGASRQVLRAVRQGRLEICASPSLWLEYEYVLKLDRIRDMHGLSPSSVDTFLDALAGLTKPVQIHFLWRPQLQDPKDELVLETVLNGEVYTLVTFNARDFLPAARRFHLLVISPAECLALLEKRP